MPFRTYEKIHRLGKEETDGILDGIVYIQEKVDGANTSIWMEEDGSIRMGSRNNDVTEGSFNGFCDYVRTHEGIVSYLMANPSHRLYGEWLVRHTIAYNETAYRKFYLFDILVGDDFMDADKVIAVGEQYSIDTVPYHGMFERPTIEQINELVGKSSFGDRGEGVVIKNPRFRNAFGDFCYAKIVTQSFKEDNAITFGGNNKHSDTYQEMYFVNKYITLPRVQKIMNKIAPTLDLNKNGEPERLDMKHIPRIMGTVYHDMITEEGWEIANEDKKVDFKQLRILAGKKAKQIYVDILNDSISVADEV